MSDRGGGDTTRDVLLRVRVENLSTAGFGQVSEAVKTLTNNLDAQITAASKAAISERELAASIEKLNQASRNLTGIATAIDRFKDFDRTLATGEARVESAGKKLAEYRQSLESTGDTSAKAERTLAQLVKAYEREQTQLATLRQAYTDLGTQLQKAGIDTNNLALAEQNLKNVAGETGQALTRLNQAKLDYAQNSRLAREAAAAENAERVKAAGAAKLEAAAIEQTRLAREKETNSLREMLSAMMASNRETVAVERAKYESMLAATQNFNSETRALAKQRNAEEVSAARVAVAEQRAIIQQRLADQRAFYESQVAQLRRFNEETRALNRQRANDPANAAVAEIRAGLRPPIAAPGTTGAPVAAAAQRGTGGNAPGLFGLRPYELQNLSYQINDVITGFASGQRATQIFAQQGGQILQLFGKNLFAIVGYLPLIAVGFGALTVVIQALGRAFRELASTREFNATLTLNADGAVYATKTLNDLRKSIRDLGVDWKDAGDLIKTGIAAGLKPEVIGDFAKAARDMSDVTGKKVPDAMRELTTAFTHGFDAVKKLDDEQNFLNADQYKLIRSLFDAGKSADAQALAFDIYKKKVSDAQKEGVGPFTEAIRKLSAAYDSFLVTLGNSSFISALVEGLTGLLRIIDRTVTGLDNLIEKARKSQKPLSDAQKAALEPIQTAADVADQGLLYSAGKALYNRFFGGPPVVSTPIPPPIPGSERFSTGGLKIDTESLRQLAGIIGEGSKALPPGYRVEAISTERPGATVAGTDRLSEHAQGRAIDVRIVDETGRAVPGSMGGGGPLYRQLDEAVEAAAAKAGALVAVGSRFTRSDAGHYSLGGQEAANQATKEGRAAAEIQATATEKTKKNLEDADKLITDLRDKDATANEAAQRRLDLENARQELQSKGFTEEAVNRYANAVADQKALERQRDRSSQDRQDQIRRVQAGAEEERVRAVGVAARQAAETQGNQNQADLRRIQLDAENLERAKIQQKEKETSELRTIDNQLAALARQNELKNVNDIEARVKAVANQYTAILNNVAKFRKDFPNVDIGNRVSAIEGQRDEATQLARAQGFMDKLTALQSDRNALISTYNTLVEKGAVSISEAEDKVREAFQRTSPAINAAASEFANFLTTADKIDPTKLDLYNAKIKEIRANATYISPLMKTIKDTVENSFSSGLSTAFNTVSEAVGNLIAKTGSYKDVLNSVKAAAANFFAQLLKDIATAIIKYEALKIASSLFGGSTGGGGGIGGILGTLFGGGSSTTAAAGATTAATTATSQTGIFGLGFLGLHQGGVVGQVAPRGRAPAWWFADAPRYHNGRVVGLAPNEEAAILQRGEEVLSAGSPRNVLNGGGQAGDINIRNVLIDDRNRIPEAMTGSHGERVVIQHLVNNAATVREIAKG